MTVEGIKCLIKCRCYLPQFRKQENPPDHHFIVFVKIENDVVVPKIAQCNNCGVLHRVVDLCKSEILNGREQSVSILTIDDIKLSLQPNLVLVLENNNADLPTWELAQFIVENERWGSFILLSTETDGKNLQGKILRILGQNLVKVENFEREEVF